MEFLKNSLHTNGHKFKQSLVKLLFIELNIKTHFFLLSRQILHDSHENINIKRLY